MVSNGCVVTMKRVKSMYFQSNNIRLLLALLIAVLLATLPSIASGLASSDQQICDIRADYALGLEDYWAAIALHRHFLISHNKNALAHYHLGFAYGMVGDEKKEICEYLEALKLGLHEWDLFLNLGIAYLSREQASQAIAALQMAALSAPEHPEVHFELAIAYERAGRLSKALQQIATSLRLKPRDPDQLNEEALIYAKLGERDSARNVWARLAITYPNYSPARLNLQILNGSH